jgi:hypothetical protein
MWKYINKRPGVRNALSNDAQIDAPLRDSVGGAGTARLDIDCDRINAVGSRVTHILVLFIAVAAFARDRMERMNSVPVWRQQTLIRRRCRHFRT